MPRPLFSFLNPGAEISKNNPLKQSEAEHTTESGFSFYREMSSSTNNTAFSLRHKKKSVKSLLYK